MCLINLHSLGCAVKAHGLKRLIAGLSSVRRWLSRTLRCSASCLKLLKLIQYSSFLLSKAARTIHDGKSKASDALAEGIRKEKPKPRRVQKVRAGEEHHPLLMPFLTHIHYYVP